MITILNRKYVFHIPLYKLENNQLQKIDTEIIKNFIRTLGEYGFDSLYTTKTTGYYHNSSNYEQVLITLYTEEKIDGPEPHHLFKQWYHTYHSQLKQETYVYEVNGTMIIKKHYN